MADPSSRLERLKVLLLGRDVPSQKTVYHCCYVDDLCVIFSETKGIRKVMLPTEMVLEYISAYEFGIINVGMSAREMRNEVSIVSEWAPYQHGFETHLRSVVMLWDSKSD